MENVRGKLRPSSERRGAACGDVAISVPAEKNGGHFRSLREGAVERSETEGARRPGKSFARTNIIGNKSRIFVIAGKACERRLRRNQRAGFGAAVEKIEDQRKPEDFFGHRKRAF